MKYLLVLVSIVFFTSCTQENISENPVNDASGTTSSGSNGDSDSNVISDVQEALSQNNTAQNGEYTLFFDGTGTQSIEIDHKTDENTMLYFINSEATSMQVSIDFPEGEGNLRLSQIIMPDGTMDGPFGIDTTYALTQFGGYQLRLHENMMAGEPWSGNATITVTLTK